LTRPARQPEPAAASFVSTARTHTGGRQLNEDRVLERPDVGLWAVADGMGGHRAGEVASTMVVEALGRVARFASGYAYLNDVAAHLHAVNREMLDSGGGSAGRPGLMGSTVVALLAHEGYYACVWAGDSRAYLLRGGRLVRITHDHSLVQEMVDSGALTADQARSHPRANVITRAIGVADPLLLEKRHAPIEPGDLFLLCSDGLTGTMQDEEIEERLLRGDLDQAADDLLGLALGRGARDNVSLVLVSADSPAPR
jgi:serine/threonine protein phosphatase PrpC